MFSLHQLEFSKRQRRAPGRLSRRARRAHRFPVRPSIEFLEVRLTPTGNIAVTNAFLVNPSDQPVSSVSPGEYVDIQVDFTTQDLPSGASYRIEFDLNGLTFDTAYIGYGAGESGLQSWYYYDGSVVPSPGANQATVDVDPDQSVLESSYADNTSSFTFDATGPAVGPLSYTASQIHAAYGISSIPDFGSATPDGTGQTIAVIDPFNDPNIITDLDGFDESMNVSTNTGPTLYQQYGPASSLLTIYNQTGTNITSLIGNSGEDGVPPLDPTGDWELEETLDVEWAHAIAPGARIDLIECSGAGQYYGDFEGAATAADLPGVTVVSMSMYWPEDDFSGSSELGYDSTFTTPSGHPGVTFVAATGDSGVPSGYPAYSPNVIGVGASQLEMNGSSYSSESSWSFPTPRTLDNGSSSYSQSGSWTSQSGGYGGTYSTAPAGSSSTAQWSTSIAASDMGWNDAVEVSTTWVPSPTNATNATYKIYDGTATTGTLLGTVNIDQTQAPGGTYDGNAFFQSLGDYYPQSGKLTVLLSANSANGTVVADAVGIAPAWASGGGQSEYEPEPSYQTGVQSTGYRTNPDVSFNGSDQTGVTVFVDGQLEFDYSGTSLATPCWAGLMAIINQGRVANGGASLNTPSNPTQALQGLYSLPANDWNDITTGYNGTSAGPGYDEVTGLGSPIANLIVPALASYDLENPQLAVSAQPPASTIAGSPFGLSVRVENAAGGVLTNYQGTVTIALLNNPTQGTLLGTLSVPVSDGVAVFSGLTLDSAGSAYTIVATMSGVSSANTTAFAITAGKALTLAVSNSPPSTERAGTSFGLGVAVEDRYGNVVTDYSGSVSILLSVDPTGDTLRGTLTATVASGAASFSGLTLDLAAAGYVIAASSNGLASATSGPFAITASTAKQLVLASAPAPSATAGVAFLTQPVIEEEDQYGNPELSDDSTVVIVALASGAGPLEGATTVTLSGGEATFVGLTDMKAGTITLSFKSGTLKSVTSSAIVVGAAPAFQLVMKSQPGASATAGQAFLTPPVVEEEDQYGNLETSDDSTVVTVSLASGSGPLQGATMATLSGGVATFSGLADDIAGTIRLELQSGNLQPATSSQIVVGPATAIKLAIEFEPSATGTAGQPFGAQPVIEEEDQYGNLESGDYGTQVTAALSSGAGLLQGTDSAMVIGGLASFSDLEDDTAETITLTFESGSLAPATSAPIVVSPAGASQLVVSTQPSSTSTAGEAFLTQPVIIEEDQFGNLETSDDSTVVTASVGSGPGPLEGATTATLSGGVATFTNLADNKAGTIKLAFTSGFLPAAKSGSIIVDPGPATRWIVATQPSAEATAGVAFPTQPVVDLADQYGNVETGDSSTLVTASLASGFPELKGTITVPVAGGVATFIALSDEKSGTLTLEFSGGSSLTKAIAAQTVVSAAPASQLVVQTPVSPTATAGQPFATQPVIDEEDPFGNLETGDDRSSVTVSPATGSGALEGTTTVTVSGGIATFVGLADNKAGTITLSFKNGGLKPAVTGSVVVSPAPASQLVIETQPSATATAGEVFPTQPIVEEEDPYGNVETADNSTAVTASVQNGALPLEGTTTVTVSAGVATFADLADDKAGPITLAFTGGNLASATANSVAVAPAAPAVLLFTNQPPSSITAGAPFGLVVTAEDRFENLEPSFNGNVVVSLAANPRGDTLNGSLTVQAIAGVASFDGLALDLAATGDTIRVSSTGLAATLSRSVTVTAGPATRLGVTSQPPSSVAPDASFTLVVAAEDRFGNLVASQTGSVTAALASGSGGTLSGPSTASLASGLATFTGLTLNKAGAYSLELSGAQLAAAVSSSFTVLPPPTITSEEVLMKGKGKQKRLSGFELFFSAPLVPSRAENAANFVVTQTLKHGKKKNAQPVSVRVVYDAVSQTVSLTLAGKPAFTLGGQIVVNASALSGITDLAGTALDGNNDGVPGDSAVLTIAAKGKRVTG